MTILSWTLAAMAAGVFAAMAAAGVYAEAHRAPDQPSLSRSHRHAADRGVEPRPPLDARRRRDPGLQRAARARGLGPHAPRLPVARRSRSRWQITIVDNASTDGTLRVARRLIYELPEVGAMHLPAEGSRPGAADRVVGERRRASLAYMDVDLSTDLPRCCRWSRRCSSGHSDLAIGTRLHRAARVDAQPPSAS